MREALKDRPARDFTVPPEAVIQPDGGFGICYKAGTIGRGISETAVGQDSAEGLFLREDFGDETLGPGPPPDRPDDEIMGLGED
jgi:hypothetical protein